MAILKNIWQHRSRISLTEVINISNKQFLRVKSDHPASGSNLMKLYSSDLFHYSFQDHVCTFDSWSDSLNVEQVISDSLIAVVSRFNWVFSFVSISITHRSIQQKQSDSKNLICIVGKPSKMPKFVEILFSGKSTCFLKAEWSMSNCYGWQTLLQLKFTLCVLVTHRGTTSASRWLSVSPAT